MSHGPGNDCSERAFEGRKSASGAASPSEIDPSSVSPPGPNVSQPISILSGDLTPNSPLAPPYSPITPPRPSPLRSHPQSLARSLSPAQSPVAPPFSPITPAHSPPVTARSCALAVDPSSAIHPCSLPHRSPSTLAREEAEQIRRIERERQRARRAIESESDRLARLARNRQDSADRLAAETPAEREARLLRLRERRSEIRRSLNPTERADREVRLRHSRDLNDPLFGAAFSYTAAMDYQALPAVNIGKLDHVCQFCSARSFRGEADGLCCCNGRVRVDPICQPPEPILTLFSGLYAESRQFLRNIRRYNSCFQMTSFGVTGNVAEAEFMPTFRVQGQIYHRIGSLLPLPGTQPKFLQIYFIGDSNAQLDLRCRLFRDVQRGIVDNFQELFDRHNKLIRTFRTALDRMPSDEHRIVIRADRTPTGEHERRFNAPAEEEVAIVMVDSEHSRRDIVIQRRNQQLLRIDEMHPAYDALQYPIIFWMGNDTYHYTMKQVNPTTGEPTNKKVSTMSYYSHQLMIRDDRHNFVLKCGPLLSQFVVDMYAKIESERLRFLRFNQDKLRVDSYIHLRDAVLSDGNAANVGQQFILPSSFIGSPRHMHEYAQDAMAYVRLHGRPDLFITFTCNPTWSDITDLLMPHQPAHDRHDLTARVFRQKLLKLMAVITKHKVFGATRCFMYSIEWQKRGLPHAHILVWLQNRIRPEQIDSVISAELPDPEQDPILFGIVLKSMVHGPCGRLNPNSPCMNENHQCTKRYPRAFLRETQTGEDGYPLYRRRCPEDGGHSAVIESRSNSFTIDNRWIVPYCPILSRMFNAHLNVEYCNSVKSIKYICKYINKGSDMAILELDSADSNSNDEITRYQLGRYISSNEAFWRIFSFPIHDRYPAVVHLSVHLENGQRVYFTQSNVHAVIENPPNTTLTAFFSLCSTDEFARTLLYTEVPTYYTWNQSRKCFSRRRQGTIVPGFDGRASDVIGRMYTVHPSNSECFFLRMLLTKIRGPTSFEYLRTYEGRVCETYREACQLRGLLEDDRHWESALREAAATRSPRQMRRLFALIISACSPSNPSGLWEKFKQDLSEDILMRQRRANPSLDLQYTEAIFNEALILIEDICLTMAGKVLIELGLPAPNRSFTDPFNSEILRETSYNADQLNEFVATHLPNLVDDQRVAFSAITSAISGNQGGLFFLDAPGGTGKTFLINLILAQVRQRGHIILAVASSGIASTLLEGGRTAHSAFKLPLDVSRCEYPVCGITRSSAKGRMLQQCKAIIWDECTMAHKKLLEALDRTLRDLRSDQSIMGGVVVVLAGDFRQTLPVIRRATPADELNACLKQSELWRHVQKFHLSTNMRVHLRGEAGADAFCRTLLSIGNGSFPSDPRTSMIQLSPDFCCLVSSADELIERVFPNLNSNYRNKVWLCERAILAPTNELINELNLTIQDKLLHVPSRTYLSVDQTVEPDQAVNYPVEFLNSLSPPGLPPHKLTLKVGSPIMLLRNLDPPKLCNGTRLSVKRMSNNLLEATILAGAHRGEDVFIPRIPFIPTDLIFEFKRLQFPVRLAYAITINKSQGQSLKVAGVTLPTPCFSHGQLYVAFSRVGAPSNLYVFAPENKTKNIVYQQALQ